MMQRIWGASMRPSLRQLSAFTTSSSLPSSVAHTSSLTSSLSSLSSTTPSRSFGAVNRQKVTPGSFPATTLGGSAFYRPVQLPRAASKLVKSAIKIPPLMTKLRMRSYRLSKVDYDAYTNRRAGLNHLRLLRQKRNLELFYALVKRHNGNKNAIYATMSRLHRNKHQRINIRMLAYALKGMVNPLDTLGRRLTEVNRKLKGSIKRIAKHLSYVTQRGTTEKDRLKDMLNRAPDSNAFALRTSVKAFKLKRRKDVFANLRRSKPVREFSFILMHYDHRILNRAVNKFQEMARRLGLQPSNPIHVARRIKKHTVLRSVHVDKSSREQFERRFYRQVIRFRPSLGRSFGIFRLMEIANRLIHHRVVQKLLTPAHQVVTSATFLPKPSLREYSELDSPGIPAILQKMDILPLDPYQLQAEQDKAQRQQATKAHE